MHAGDRFWTGSSITCWISKYAVVWISKYSLCLFARKMHLAFIWNWSVQKNEHIWIVLPDWIDGSLLTAVQHQVCWIQSCYFLCDVALEWPAGVWAITGAVVRLLPAWLCLNELWKHLSPCLPCSKGPGNSAEPQCLLLHWCFHKCLNGCTN